MRLFSFSFVPSRWISASMTIFTRDSVVMHLARHTWGTFFSLFLTFLLRRSSLAVRSDKQTVSTTTPQYCRIMFKRVLGFGAQALVLELADATSIEACIPDELPSVHREQARNRGCVTKIVRTEPWGAWLEFNCPTPSAPFMEEGGCYSADTLRSQLCCVTRDELARMVDGARRISALRSNFVVPYLNVVATESELRIVMPKYSMTLQQWAHLHQKRLTEAALLKIGYQLTLGLIDLHDEGIFHLDFHGGNVFVANSKSAEPHCVVADLEASYYDGISHDASSAFTEPFAAPERPGIRVPRPTRGEPRGVVLESTLGKCDVWSLGLLLYSMAADSEFPGVAEATDELGTILMNHKKLTPTRIAAIVRRDLTTGHDGTRRNAPFSEGVISLLTMMLNHDPKTRPALYDVLDSLQKLLDATSGGRLTGQQTLPFPLALPPFQLVKVPDNAACRVAWYPSSSMFDVHGACARCNKPRSSSQNTRSDCGMDGALHLPSHSSAPWSKVGGHARLLPGMPMCDDGADARGGSAEVGAVFLYPMYGDGSKSQELLAEVQRGSSSASVGDALIRLLQLQGGFAFVSLSDAKRDHVTPREVFTIVPCGTKIAQPAAHSAASPLCLPFSAAQPWPSACTWPLKQAGRIHTDVPSLLGTTAKCFSWLMPGEQFELPNDERWTPAPLGGLVFWFEPDARQPHDQDRFFALCEPLPQLSGVPVFTAEALAIASRASSVMDSMSSSLQRGCGAIAAKLESAVRMPTSSMRGPVAFRTSSADGGEPIESPAQVTNLTDRTPAGRVYFDDLDAVSPATYNNRTNASSTRSSMEQCHAGPSMPRPVSHSPEMVARVSRTNIEGYRIHPPTTDATGAAAMSANTSRRTSESRPSTFAQTAANSIAGSRAPSQSQPSFHVHPHVHRLQQGEQHQDTEQRYPSLASQDAMRGGSVSSVSSGGGERSIMASIGKGGGLPPRPTASQDASQTGAAHSRGSADSTLPVSTRPSSFFDGAMPPPTRTATPVDQRYPRDSSCASVLTDASPVVMLSRDLQRAPLPPGTGVPHASGGSGAPFPSQQLQFDASPSIAPSMDPFGRRTTSSTASTHADESPIRGSGGTDLSSGADLWTEWNFPVLEATVSCPGPEVLLSPPSAMSGVTRFRIVSSGEYGSCGPVVTMTPSSLLFQRLKLSLYHPGEKCVSFACFCAVDIAAQPLGVSSLGPGGARAASAYHASERFLQHHGLLLLNADFQPCGLVSFRVFLRPNGGLEGQFPSPPAVRLPVIARTVVSHNTAHAFQPHGELGDFDPFLSAPQLLRVMRPSAVHDSGSLASSRTTSAVASRTGSFNGRGFGSGLCGSPRHLALDLQNNQLYVGCAGSTSWLQLCLT